MTYQEYFQQDEFNEVWKTLHEVYGESDFKPLTYYEIKIAQEHLVPIVSILLKQAGWDDAFCIRMDANGKLSLYLRIAYVSACSIEGNWDQIRAHIIKFLWLRGRSLGAIFGLQAKEHSELCD